MSHIAKAASREAVGSLLDKAFGTKKDEAPADGAPTEPAPEGSPSDLIKKGLDGLFGR